MSYRAIPRSFISTWLVAVPLATAAASGAFAAPVAEVSTDASASFLSACSDLQTSSGPLTTGCLVAAYARTASSQASAAPGVLRADAFSAADAPDLNLGATFAYSRAYASFTDYLTFSGAANTQVTIHAAIRVSGSVTSNTWGSPYSGSGDANYTISGGLFGANFSATGTFEDFADGTSNIVNPNGSQLIPLSFVVTFDANGQSSIGAFSMSVTVDASANAFGSSDPTTGVFLPGHTEASAVFGSTIYWAGVTGVFDAQGNPLVGVTASSESGLDYMLSAIPVPEPASSTLLGLYLAALALRSRRSIRA